MRQLDGNSRSADLQLNTDATGQDTPNRRRTDALPKDTDDKSRAADKCQAAYQSKKADRSAEGSAQPRLHKKRTTGSRILYSQGRLCQIGSGYLRLSNGEKVQVLMKASENDREDTVGWFFRSERV